MVKLAFWPAPGQAMEGVAGQAVTLLAAGDGNCNAYPLTGGRRTVPGFLEFLR